MDRVTLQRHLDTAERRVSEADGHIELQRNLIERLRRDGYNTGQAEKLLRAIVQTQDFRRTDVARFRRELAVPR